MLDLTNQAGGVIISLGASHLLVGGNRLRLDGGIFVPGFCPVRSLWRESGSGNARACPTTGVSSRHHRDLTVSMAAILNARVGGCLR